MIERCGRQNGICVQEQQYGAVCMAGAEIHLVCALSPLAKQNTCGSCSRQVTGAVGAPRINHDHLLIRVTMCDRIESCRKISRLVVSWYDHGNHMARRNRKTPFYAQSPFPDNTSGEASTRGKVNSWASLERR